MGSINIQAQACVACEGRPPPENTLCAVCGAGQPAASAEPMAWFIDWPDEPDLGHRLAEALVDGARSRALVFQGAVLVTTQIAAYDVSRRPGLPRPGRRRWQFDEPFEYSFTKSTGRFMWCRYALAWGIQKYGEHKEAAY